MALFSVRRAKNTFIVLHASITMLAYYVLPLAFALYRLFKVVYNLYFHPLAKFPGPKLAAASHLYEFYWSVVRDGQFIWVLERLHKEYGTCFEQTSQFLTAN